ncbi:MAG: hypothetical protein LUE29_03105 [Lachnospiraceae bacterium]|nr:hypothetical protein [Lachnospiraceae bacterium]
MAEKELRKMNRTELIEIIYALQQNERSIREENEELRRQLDDRLLRLEQAGSIAEAALSLNHVFEDAEEAAQQYLLSLQEGSAGVAEVLADAQKKADAMLAETEEKADAIISDAEKRAQQTDEECRVRLEKTEQEIQRKRAAFAGTIRRVVKKYPELAARMREEAGKGQEPDTS